MGPAVAAAVASILGGPAALGQSAGDGAATLGPLVAQERQPLAFLLSTPTGEGAKTSSSELIRIVADLTEGHTSFFLQLVDPQVATDCRGRMGCLVQQLRAPFPKYLLVLSNVTLAGEADRLSAVLLDVGAALDQSRTLAPEDQTSESRINEYAVLLGPERAQVAGARETEVFLETLFTRKLAPIFEASGDWEPFATIELTGVVEGLAVNLDGTAIGVTRPGTTRIVNVLAGTRRLSLEHPGFEPFDRTLELERGKTLGVPASLEPRGSGTARSLREGLFWAGLGAAAAGAAVTVVAIAGQDAGLEPVCLGAPGATCRTAATFTTFGYAPSARPGELLNPPGLMIAPLGVALATTGATWALGVELFGEPTELPWLQVVAGVATGALVYGAAAALGSP